MSKPQGIGDDVAEYVIIPEVHPMPVGWSNLIAVIETLLSAGGVQ